MSTTNARTTITDFTSDEIEASEHKSGAWFLNITSRCDVMVGHSASPVEEVVEEIRALRKLAATALDVASQMETRQIRRDGADLGHTIAADEGLGEQVTNYLACGDQLVDAAAIEPGTEVTCRFHGQTTVITAEASAADVDRAIAADLNEQTGGES